MHHLSAYDVSVPVGCPLASVPWHTPDTAATIVCVFLKGLLHLRRFAAAHSLTNTYV